MTGGARAGTADGALPLSVVVIAENEEERIGPCLESVLAACDDAASAYEVALVDSGSSDRTVEVAADYPVSIYRIPPEAVVSCGAGRYVGDRFSRGELVLHVDGDTVLSETWLPRAVEYLRDHDDVVAVEGCLNESTQDGVTSVRKVGGVMLFDAEALRSVGGFDPHLLGYEDVDVGYRLSAAGYRLARLPEVSADHPTEGGFSEPIRRWRAGYYDAPGQAIRKAVSSPRVLARLVARQHYKLALLAWLCVGVLSRTSRRSAAGWLALSLAGFALVASRRGLVGAVQFLAIKSLGIVGLFRGFVNPPGHPDEFPIDAVEVVKEGPVVRERGRSAGESAG